MVGAGRFPRRSLHGRVAHEIGLRILGGDLAPGALLPSEAVLGGQLNVSRTSLREGIKLLAAKGLIESRPKTGTRVRGRDQWNMLDRDVLGWRLEALPTETIVEDLFEVRRMIEPAAAALAAERGTPEELAGIKSAYEAMEAAGDDPVAVTEPDLWFHRGILAATHNELLISLGGLIESALSTSFEISNSAPEARFHGLVTHGPVAKAIAVRDAAAARVAMERLLDGAINDVRTILADGGRNVSAQAPPRARARNVGPSST